MKWTLLLLKLKVLVVNLLKALYKNRNIGLTEAYLVKWKEMSSLRTV